MSTTTTQLYAVADADEGAHRLCWIGPRRRAISHAHQIIIFVPTFFSVYSLLSFWHKFMELLGSYRLHANPEWKSAGVFCTSTHWMDTFRGHIHATKRMHKSSHEMKCECSHLKKKNDKKNLINNWISRRQWVAKNNSVVVVGFVWFALLIFGKSAVYACKFIGPVIYWMCIAYCCKRCNRRWHRGQRTHAEERRRMKPNKNQTKNAVRLLFKLTAAAAAAAADCKWSPNA